MYKEDLALNNLQWLICHKIKPNQTIADSHHFFYFGETQIVEVQHPPHSPDQANFIWLFIVFSTENASQRQNLRAIKEIRHFHIKKEVLEMIQSMKNFLNNEEITLKKNPVSWGCRIRPLHLCRGLRPHHHYKCLCPSQLGL